MFFKLVSGLYPHYSTIILNSVQLFDSIKSYQLLLKNQENGNLKKPENMDVVKSRLITNTPRRIPGYKLNEKVQMELKNNNYFDRIQKAYDKSKNLAD